MAHLIGDRIILREFRESDYERVHHWVNNESITKYISISTFYQTEKQTREFMDRQISGKDEHNKCWVIALKENDQYIGSIGLHGIDWINRRAELGIVIGYEEYLDKGYGTEAIKLLLDFSFRQINLHRVRLRVHEYNQRGIQCYKNCGFKEEGRMRDEIFYQGKFWDMIFMGILEDEYISPGMRDR